MIYYYYCLDKYFKSRNIDIMIYRYMIFGNEYSINILNETILTLCFLYQENKISNYLDGFLIFDGLSTFYKEKIENSQYFKHLLQAFIFKYL